MLRRAPARPALLLLLALAGSGAPAPARAADATAQADDIIRRARAAQRVDRSVQSVEMTLEGKGPPRVRAFELRVRRDPDGLVRSWTRFSAPADVAGTQLVIVDHPSRADEQLLYLPALQRTNRIAGKARSGAFMGSDFAFEDLEVSGADAARHTLQSESATAWVIETVPGPESTYGRLMVTISKADALPREVRFHDKAGAHIKTLTVAEVKVQDGVPVPVVSVMEDHRKGTRTRLVVTSVRLQVPETDVPDELFTAAGMERRR